ncbi:hypothetical protein [Heliothis virescens ascovirus 3e]|uniref:Uncharacterized protein n=1 Tax=Heliothis virescens ascovirus 3e TaxID=260797 RepID=A4KXJ2_HVAVE|nr:hypothetical protein HVAV3e_gp136 [Heliothis virescens ascovirus 3e]ABO37323.1 hypothetical protein [Heliothis virescens ascovirus 3e]
MKNDKKDSLYNSLRQHYLSVRNRFRELCIDRSVSRDDIVSATISIMFSDRGYVNLDGTDPFEVPFVSWPSELLSTASARCTDRDRILVRLVNSKNEAVQVTKELIDDPRLRSLFLIMAPGTMDDCVKLRHELDHLSERRAEVWHYNELSFPAIYHDHQPLFVHSVVLPQGPSLNLPKICRNDVVVRYFRLSTPNVIAAIDHATGKRELRSLA